MSHGNRVSGQKPVTHRNRPSGGNQTANCGHQFLSRQNGRDPGSSRRTDTEELEKPALREIERSRGGKINPTEQTMAGRFLDRYDVQAKQDYGVESRGLSLTGGGSWLR